MKLVLVPAGEFMMGLASEEIRHWNDPFKRQGQGLKIDNEGPLHRVRITRPFYLGVCHVTVGQFRKFVTDAGFQTDAEKGRPQGRPRHGFPTGRFEFKAEYSCAIPGFKQSADEPVVCASWKDAVAFGNVARPQRAEGLPAAHGKPSGNMPAERERQRGILWKSNIAALGDYAWWSGNSYRRTHAVGGKRPNRFGLYDMQGNACQWCADRVPRTGPREAPVHDPKGPLGRPARALPAAAVSQPRRSSCRCSARLCSPSGRSCIFRFSGGMRSLNDLARGKRGQAPYVA